MKLEVMKPELTGLRAAVGYSAVVIASTLAVGPPSLALSARIDRAKPHQLVLPSLQKW